MSSANEPTFKGTKFESMENKIKNDLNKKRKRDDNSSEKAHSFKSSSSKKPIKSLDLVSKSQIKAFNKSKSVTQPLPTAEKTDHKVTKSQKAVAVGSSRTEPENSYNNDRTVYIQGIPFTCKEKDVTDFFKGCGEIVSVRLPKWHDSGNLKGYGHVEFRLASEADKALELSGQYLKDRYVMIERPMTPRVLQAQSSSGADSGAAAVEKVRPAGCRTVFVKNIPYDITETELLEAFRVYGPVASIRLAEWGHTKNLKGFGYIEFQRENSAEIAVKKSGTLTLKDRAVIVDYETGKPKGSFKDNIKVAGGKVKSKGFSGAPGTTKSSA